MTATPSMISNSQRLSAKLAEAVQLMNSCETLIPLSCKTKVIGAQHSLEGAIRRNRNGGKPAAQSCAAEQKEKENSGWLLVR